MYYEDEKPKIDFCRSNPEIHRRIKKDLLFELSGFNTGLSFRSIWSQCCFVSLAVIAVFRAFAVIRHLQNPDHFVVQLFSYTLEKRFRPLIMLSFPPIRAQKSDLN